MRHFTNNEIEYIMKDIDSLFPNYLPEIMKKSYLNSIEKYIRNSLECEKIEDNFDDLLSLKNEIEKNIAKSLIQAGESVGVICAQSIGERQTQLSVDKNTKIYYWEYNNLYHDTIENIFNKFIENKLEINITNNNIIVPCWNDKYKIMMVDTDGNIKKATIVEWSKHKNIGKMINVITDTNKSVNTTISHSHLKLNYYNKIVPILGSDLKIGDKIPCLNKPFNEIEKNYIIQWEKIINIIEDNNYIDYVYDISVEGNQTFMIDNGIFVHNTLNSFHQSGLAVATVVTGVPRFLELLNATKDPKMISDSFYLKGDNINTPNDCRNIIGDSLIHTHLYDLCIKDIIRSESFKEEFWYEPYEIIYGNEFKEYNSCISIYLDINLLFDRQITLLKIKQKIESIYDDIICVISPLYIGQIDLYIKITDQIFEEFQKNINNIPLTFQRKNPIEIYLFQVIRPKILEIEISGIKNISKYHFRKIDENWCIETEGSNFLDMLGLPFINIETVRSNNMWNIYNTMGIEATREFLIEEFTNIVSSDGTFINPCHILLLVDIMTYQGNINSISRYSMKKEQMGVLSRSSFEESLDQFCNAGCYSEIEPINAVSANIMCGKRSNIGSGLCSLIMDWNKISNK